MIRDTLRPERLEGLIREGRPEYGLGGVGAGKDTAGSRLLASAILKPDARPLWITLWGGAVDLAQALTSLRMTRTPAQMDALLAHVRVYSISDQDDAGPWIRREFSSLFWIASVHAFSDYNLATWYGVSGDLFLRPHEDAPPLGGPDGGLVTNAWLERNIRRGPLGRLYPPWKYIMEGDTPSFLHVIPNGLNDPEHPEHGGWGGRYGRLTPHEPLYVDASDSVVGADGKTYRDNKATIWRWREGYQNDFAARMAWTVAPRYADANHAPAALVNGQDGRAPVLISAAPGATVLLDPTRSSDPDGDKLRFIWRGYPEADGDRFAAPVTLEIDGQGRATARLPPQHRVPANIILEVWDSGAPAMVAYRRVIISNPTAASP